MWRHYFKIGIRALWRNKTAAFVNVAGLSVGMACSLMIFLWVQDELTYDTHWKNADRLYRLNCDVPMFGGPMANTAFPAGKAFAEQLPEIEAHTVTGYVGQTLFVSGEKKVETPSSGLVSDSLSFFSVFDFAFREGEPDLAKGKAVGIMLETTLANKLFGNESAIGKVVKVPDYALEGEVCGVYEPVPDNSHFHPSFVAIMPQWGAPLYKDSWGNASYYNYYLLAEDAAGDEERLADIKARMAKIAEPNLPSGGGFELSFYLQAIVDTHLDSATGGTGNVLYVRVFSVVALFVLLIACANFMNLATARSAKRAVEVGMRKVIGARREQLVGQFLSESVLLAVLSLVIAIGIAQAVLPAFSVFTGKTLSLDSIDWGMTAAIIGATVLTGLFAGSYPAFYLSAFEPVNTLKGGKTLTKGGGLRRGLVGLQFALTAMLAVSTGAIYLQVRSAQQKDAGYDRQHMIVAKLGGPTAKNFAQLRDELTRHTAIDYVGAAESPLYRIPNQTNDPHWRSQDTTWETGLTFTRMFIDPHFEQDMGLELVAGRYRDPNLAADSAATLINETAAHKMGFATPEDAIGAEIRDNGHWTIIGVMKDFHFLPLQHQINPALILPSSWAKQWATVRYRDGQAKEALAHIKKTWAKFDPDRDPEPQFADQQYQAFYESEERVGQLLNVFAGLAVFVSCLGLLGLVTFSAERRTKEIGIRKVLGASVGDIVRLLTQEYAWLVLVASAAGSLGAYFAVKRWFFAGFAYQGVQWSDWAAIVGVSALGLLVFALAVAGWKAVLASMNNPSEALKHE